MNYRRYHQTLVTLALLSGVTRARAEEGTSAGAKAPYERGGLTQTGIVAGAKVGAGLSQAFNPLGTSFVGELELGYLLPPLERAIQVFVSGQYAAPSADGSGVVDRFGPSDGSRLPGSTSYELVQRQIVVSAGGLYRLKISGSPVRPYAGLGARLYLMRSEITGSAGGQPFGANEETDRRFGFLGLLGAEAYLGPGALLLELQIGAAGTDTYLLKATNVSALNIGLGYRLFI